MGAMGNLPWKAAALALLVSACATAPEAPRGPAISAEEARERIASRLPAKLADAKGWAADIHAAMASLDVAPTMENICAIVAVTEQIGRAHV